MISSNFSLSMAARAETSIAGMKPRILSELGQLTWCQASKSEPPSIRNPNPRLDLHLEYAHSIIGLQGQLTLKLKLSHTEECYLLEREWSERCRDVWLVRFHCDRITHVSCSPMPTITTKAGISRYSISPRLRSYCRNIPLPRGIVLCTNHEC